MARLVAEGKSINAIVRETGSDRLAIKRRHPNVGWKQGGSTEGNRIAAQHIQEKFEASERYRRMVEMVEDGCSLNEIYKSIGVTHHHVHKYFPGYKWTFEQGLERRREEKNAEKRIAEVWGR